MRTKTFITELLIICAALIVFWVGYAYFTGTFNLSKATIDINLHDTYFVIDWKFLLLPLILLLFLLYLIKEAFYKYQRKFQNSILVLLNLLLVIALIGVVLLLPSLLSYLKPGWTLYPPLSALSRNNTGETIVNLALKAVLVWSIILVVLIVMLTINSVLLGKSWRKPKGTAT